MDAFTEYAVEGYEIWVAYAFVRRWEFNAILRVPEGTQKGLASTKMERASNAFNQ